MLNALIDLVLPRVCVGCGSPGTPLCRGCGGWAPVHLEVCGLAVVAAAPYDGGLRRALIAYKERGRRDLARPLGELLGRVVAHVPGSGTCAVLVPVPSAPSAARARGGDHLVRLTRRAGRCAQVLRLARAVRDSAGLDIAARRANLAGAMWASRAPRAAPPVVLVDDITTTGTTLGEAVRALRSAGWTVTGCAVVAATERRHPGRSTPPSTVHARRTAASAGLRRQAGLT